MAEANSYATFASANYPAQSDVVNTAPTYGDPINVLDGTLDTGTAPPQLAAADVRTGVDTGANGPGTLAVPAVGRVILGVATDNTVGTYAQLPEADGRQGEQWGEDGTEYTGTLDPGAGGTVPAASDVRFGVAVGDSTGLCHVPTADETTLGVLVDVSDTGTNRTADPAKVLQSYFYGPNDSIEGQVSPGGGLNPPLSNLVMTCLDETGQPEAGVTVNVMIASPGTVGDGIIFDATLQEQTSDVDGVVRFPCVRLTTVQARRGDSLTWQTVEIDDAETTTGPSFIGAP